MKKIIKINPLKMVDNINKLTIFYEYDEDIDEKIPNIMFDSDKYNDLYAKFFLEYLEKNCNNFDYVFNKIVKRYFKNEKINECEKNEDTNDTYFTIQTISGKKLEISHDILMNNFIMHDYLSHKMNEDFYDIYTKNKNDIQNIYVYSSKNTSSINFLIRNTNNLYIMNNSNDDYFNLSPLTRNILKDFTLLNISDGYNENEDNIYLSLAGDRKIIIDKNKMPQSYKKIINDFNDELIDMKTKKYSYRKVD